ncbi:hypothetical protein EVJ58_g6977 [Rhodofomes roseus]|uniref:Uncharacterized protein n=1 Tax=Rhodofomes roseus TaxID=34475 RepID=A0A4Y9Y654_9APHY|nr:hypothetical protein EVJ58_g6977 [Rhodofomes roseus]
MACISAFKPDELYSDLAGHATQPFKAPTFLVRYASVEPKSSLSYYTQPLVDSSVFAAAWSQEDGQSLLYVPLDALMVPPKLSARTADESESEDEDDEDETQEAPVLSPAAQSSGSASAKSYAVALSLFTAAKFQAANQMLRNVASVLQSEDSAAGSVSRQLLDGLLDAMESKDSAAARSVGFAVLLQRNWSAQTRYERDDSLQHLKHAVLRSEIMMMNYYAWLWLDCVPVNYCSRFLSSSAPSAAANDWLGRLAIAVNDGFKSYDLVTLQRQDFLPDLPPHSITMPRARFTADRRYTASIDFIQRTLRTWLDFPKNSSYVRSLFICAIILAFGCSDVLLLDSVWDVYQHAESSLLILDDRRRHLPSTHLDPLFHDLRALPILSQPTSPDACAFAEFLCLRSSSLPPLSSASSRSTPPAPQLTLQPSDSAAPGLEALHCFVMDCYGLLDHLLDEASYHSPTFFATLEDFVALRNAHPSDYICNKNAYGSHAMGHDASHGKAMFVAAPHFVEFFSDHPNVPFLDARKEFLLEPRVPGSTRKLLPGCGPLTATLLASDFVYAGKVKMPTVPEMGHVVASLKLGARAGLICLGLLSGVSATEGEVCTAFVLAYNHLEAKLPAAVKSRMNLDVIMLEHALCKLKHSGTYFKV